MNKKITALLMVMSIVLSLFQPVVVYANKSSCINMASAGRFHSLAVTTGGALYSWGWNNHGQLGDSTEVDKLTPTKVMNDVAIVSTGFFYSLAVTTGGALYSWGHNQYGKLGDGTYADKSAPTKIMDNVASVSAGSDHSLAITNDGTLYAWGYNGSGQLGDGTNTNKITPTKIMDNVAYVAAAEWHSLAITNDGTLYAWGNNESGQLGDGTTTNKITPTKIIDNVASVSTTYYYSLAITNDGTLYAWGRNVSGQLGDGTTTNKITPTKIMDNVASVSAGLYHSLAITNDGTLYAWGLNVVGQFGDGTTTNTTTPTKIMDNVSYVSAGGFYSLAITNDGTLYACGNNEQGQLGDGTTNGRIRWTKVIFPEDMDNSTQVTGIDLNKSTATLSVGSTKTLTATITPTTATDKNITWKSSDNTIATVDNAGLITALSSGTTIITATAHNGISTSCTVHVEEETPPITAVPTIEIKTATNSALKIGDIITANVIIKDAKNIYAEDFEIQYDNTKLEFIGVENIENMFNYKVSDSNGSLRFITASKGAEHGITGTGTIAKLRFKAVDSGSVTIQPANAKVADNTKTEISINAEAHIGTALVIDNSPSDNSVFTLGDLAYLAYNYGEDTNILDEYFKTVLEDGTVDDISLNKIVEEILSN